MLSKRSGAYYTPVITHSYKSGGLPVHVPRLDIPNSLEYYLNSKILKKSFHIHVGILGRATGRMYYGGMNISGPGTFLDM